MAGPILAAFDAIAAKGGTPQQIAGAQFQFIMNQIQTNALPFFQELRDNRPILQTPMATLVSQFRDVEEILHREKVFSVSPYLPRMMGVIGPFVLSQDITPRYDHDISVMHLVVRREDLSRVKDIVSCHAAAIVSELFQGAGPVDIVQTLTRKVPVRLAHEYYGFSAPQDEQMMGWARACFREFFINLLDDPAMRAPAVTAGAEMRQRLDVLLAERRAWFAAGKDDVMGRLLGVQSAGEVAGLDDDGICRTLMGLVIGMVETTSQAAVQALLVLFSIPDALASAAAAAKADDDDALSNLVFEALRFQPINPMVVRVANEDYHLAAGEPHATLIAKGTTVFALTWSAMFDPRMLDAPEQFRADRPTCHYLHFATGDHACFGRYISRVQIPQILKPLLKLQGLRPAGAPEYDGTFPQTFKVSAGP
ncbi:MAG TPA: cytochrome P450 [Acetobacteraceae bacterium]|nr:cytochrome P450 [Acetobacteraceae bacterium]